MSDIDILPLTQNRLLAPAVILTPTRRARIIETSYPDNTILFDAEILLNETSPNWSDYDFQYRAERIEL